MLSHVITLASGSPSSVPTAISERIPRIVRAMGAHVTADRTAIAASRVRTQTGRRPAGVPRSAQTMSPRATTPAWSQRPAAWPLGQPPDPAGFDDTQPEVRRPHDACLLRPKPQWLLCGGARSDSSRARTPRDRVGSPSHRPAARELRVDSQTIWYTICHPQRPLAATSQSAPASPARWDPCRPTEQRVPAMANGRPGVFRSAAERAPVQGDVRAPGVTLRSG